RSRRPASGSDENAPAARERSHPDRGSGAGGREAQFEVGDDVVDVLGADGQAHETGADPGGPMLLLAHLTVGGGSGVHHEAANIAEVGDVAVQPETLDELGPRLASAFDHERGYSPEAAATGELLGPLVPR